MSLFTSPSFWFDMICIVAFFTFCAHYVHLGFIATIVRIFGTVISLFGANYVAKLATPFIYETFFAQNIEESVSVLLTEKGLENAQSIANGLYELVPTSLQSAWSDAWVSGLASHLSGDIADIAHNLTEQFIAPIMTQLVFMVIFVFAFAICRIFVTFLVSCLTFVNDIPLVGPINKALGWILGIMGGLVDLFVLICVVWAIILVTDGGLPVLNATELASSWFFGMFQRCNPFL